MRFFLLFLKFKKKKTTCKKKKIIIILLSGNMPFSISVSSGRVHTGGAAPLCKWHCRFPPAAPLRSGRRAEKRRSSSSRPGLWGAQKKKKPTQKPALCSSSVCATGQIFDSPHSWSPCIGTMGCKWGFGPEKQLWVELEGAVSSPPEVLLHGSAVVLSFITFTG